MSTWLGTLTGMTHDPVITRRGLILGGAAMAGLAACGSANKISTAPSATTPASNFALVQRYPNTPLFTPGAVRLPVCVGEPGTGTIVRNVPTVLRGTIVDVDDKTVATFETAVRNKGVQYPYFPVRATIPEEGAYVIRAEIGGIAEAAFQIFPEAQITMPRLGSKLVGFDTPTVDDHRGVEPVCTRTPEICPFHTTTLTQAMADAAASGSGFVYFVGTPAHCQVGTCAPGLDFIINAWNVMDTKIPIVHAEVYADDLASRLAPAVEALKVDYEPIVYLCDPSGTIVDRIDTIWDQSELDEAFAALQDR